VASGARSGGNAEAKGTCGNAGNIKGNRGNAGNMEAKGKRGNAGNETKGQVKKRAGKRSGLRRCAQYALSLKKRWLVLILDGRKDWEIRGTSTTRRGWIHLAESGAGGKLGGRARLVDCLRLPRSAFACNVNHHCVAHISAVPYKQMFAWVLKDAQR